MKTKSIVKAGYSGALAVPQYTLAGTGMLLGGLEYGIRTVADGVGILKTQAYKGENYIANLREEIDAEIKAYEAEIAAEQKLLRKQQKTATA